MTDIRMYTNVNGILMIGEYKDSSSDFITTKNGKRLLSNPMFIELAPARNDNVTRIVPVVRPFNLLAEYIRDSVEEIDIDANNLLELKKVSLEVTSSIVKQYNNILSGIIGVG